jgi:hypothetical protein
MALPDTELTALKARCQQALATGFGVGKADAYLAELAAELGQPWQKATTEVLLDLIDQVTQARAGKPAKVVAPSEPEDDEDEEEDEEEDDEAKSSPVAAPKKKPSGSKPKRKR